VATESTNTAETQTGGSGKTIALVLAAVAVVLFILGLMGDYAPEGGGLSIDPMSQFEVSPLFGGDELNWFVPSNVTLWMGIAIAAVAALLVMGTRGRAVIPGRSQSMAELVYGFVHKMVEDVAGKDALPYFPYIFTAFLYIVFANVLGLIPASFTTTSHAAVTVTLALTVFMSVTVIGFTKNGVGFLSRSWLTSAPQSSRRKLP
jgi:F0F1-type ATP synthase, subunit a